MCQAWGKYRTPKMHFKTNHSSNPIDNSSGTLRQVTVMKGQWWIKKIMQLQEYFTFWLHHRLSPWHPPRWCYLQRWSPVDNLVNRSSLGLSVYHHLSSVLWSSRTWERRSCPFSFTITRIGGVQAAFTPWINKIWWLHWSVISIT